MSNIKHLPDILRVCSVLPALIVMPAVAAEYTSDDIQMFPYSIKYGDSLLVTEGISNAENGVFLHQGNLTINDDLVFDNNNTGSPTEPGFGAVIHMRNNKDTTKTIIGNNVVFSGGTALYEGSATLEPGMGGAIYSWSDGPLDGVSVIEMGDNVVFRNNTAVDGSAIYTYGYNTVTIGDNLLMENNSATGGNGAFMVNGYDAIHGTDFINTVTIGKNATFKNNTAVYRAGAFYVGGDTNDKAIFDDGAFFAKNSSSYGGAIAGFGVFEFGDVTFDSNFAFDAWDHVFKNVEGAKESDYTNYVGNGGAVLNRGSLAIKGNANFLNNHAEGYGGAIYNGVGATTDISGASALFSVNTTEAKGGAIYNYTGAVAISSDNTVFRENKATNAGGAVYSDAGNLIFNGDVAFYDNQATADDKGIGGAVALDNGAKAIFNGETVFVGNKATVDGGAIYNDTNAVLKIGDAKFVNNRASYDSWDSEGYGGAIFANGDLDIVSEKANGVMFSNNAAFSGGAVYGSMNSTIGMNLENVLFVGNHAIADAGALGIFNNDVSTLTNVVFRNNTVAVAVDGLIAEDDIKEADGGGAIQLGGTASADLVKTHFVGNESGVRGGAISARHGAGYELNITDSSFTNNKSATNGGSIANVFAGAVSIENVNFIGNKANERGGAIYNGQDWNFGSGDGGAMSSGDGILNISGTNVFSGNIAGDLGGAIFNGADGVINMTGINTFVNNTANGGANDIYNDGTLNIAADTKVVISGGIKGNGTLTLAGDATLDIGTSLVEQDKISIDGTVVASIVSGRSYGRLSSDNLAFGEEAVLQLNIGSVGTYDIFGDGKKYDVDILVGDTYIATETDRGIVIETKSVADIAEDAGLTVETAGTVANLANSVDRNLQKLSLLAQQALNSDNSALVEKETAKLAPEDENMTRSVAMSAQSQALSLASGRMMGGMGRAGGDKSQTNGFWAQGLFNKTKYADQFHGYSRGFAVGADTTIDRKYTIGAGLTHTNSDVHSGSRHTDISTTTLFAYGQYKPTDWFLNGTLVYAMSEYDENIDPFGVQINSLYNANSFGAQAMTGYALKSGLTPQVGIRYLHIEQDEYNNGVNRMNAMDYEYLSGVAGFAYSFNINNARSALQLKPELRAMLTYDLVQDNSVATVVMNNINSSYIVDGENLSRVGGEFGVGLTATYNGVDVSVMYDITLHEDYTSQTGMIKFRGQF